MSTRFIELEPENLGKPLIVNGVRYARCRKCATLKPTSQMLVYGGSGTHMNIGECRSCAYNGNERYNCRKRDFKI